MKLLQGKMEEQLKNLEDNSVDSIVCDPPYGLSFMNKGWDYEVPSVAQWSEALRVLKPGGHLLAFFGSRTYHRGAVYIEDAGFEIRDQLMWVYGSGFPKSHNLGKAYDKKYGRDRELIGYSDQPGKSGHHAGNIARGVDSTERYQAPMTAGNGPLEGWGTGLKPAHEPIVLARKPISEKNVLANVERWGTGGLNIDESRVAYSDDNPMPEMRGGITTLPNGWAQQTDNNDVVKPGSPEGRFPANFIHDGVFDQADWGKYFYVPKVSKRERNEGIDEANTHPTVKPIALMEYLIKLVTPTGGIVLDPFMGSGSTGCAAAKNGYEFIGVEMEEHSYEIAKARIEYWGSK